MKKRYATVTIREPKGKKRVEIGHGREHDITDEIIDKWQSLLDTVARIMKIPSALIMRLNEDNIEVFLKSNTRDNPYEVGEKTGLDFGLYCETVIGTQKPLLVKDARKHPLWKKDNPDIDLNMISYLGLPINYPDGTVFGTICVLDEKENHYSEDFIDLLKQAQRLAETDIMLLWSNQELKAKNRQLQQADKTKSRFLSLISHDIRNPVGTIQQLLEIILDSYDKYDSKTLKKHLEYLRDSAANTSEILENLLSWSKNELLEIKARKREINLAELIDKTTENFSQAIRLKNLSLTKSYYSDTILAEADREMMETALRNIISNAVKFTNPGGRINVRVIKKGNKNIIEIEDSGIGMTEQKVSSLFSYDKKHQVTGTRGEPTAGIGLMLAKEFLDKNNATVEVISKPGKGTKFTIIL